MLNKKRSIRKRELILFSLFLLVCLFILTGRSIRKIYANFNQLKEQIVMNEKKLCRLRSLLKESGKLNSEYEGLFTGYKNINTFDNLLQEIGVIAKKLNFNITSIKPGPAEIKNKYKKYSIRIESQDDVLTLAKFIYNLNQGLKNIAIQRLQIKAGGKDQLPKITMTLDAVVFRD